MLWFRKLSIRSQLLIVLLLVGLSGIAAVTLVGYRSGQHALKQAVLSQLDTVAATKTRQVEDYFEQVRSEVETFSEDPYVASSLLAFEDAIAELEKGRLQPAARSQLEQFYAREFLPKLASRTGARPMLSTYLPNTPAAQWLQYHYIGRDAKGWSARDQISDPGDGSRYTQIHARTHPTFRRAAERMGYFDIYLVSIKSGQVLYSISKEPDFASNLLNGPFSSSSLAEAFRKACELHDPGQVVVSDYKIHTPSFGIPSAFFAAPVFSNETRVGVVLFQLSADRVDDIMTGHQQWITQGLGKTGEAYIVGNDKLFRSNPRLLIENKARFLQTLVEPLPYVRSHIDIFGTSILNQRATTSVDEAVIQGKKGHMESRDYRGESVLAAFQPIKTPGLSWGIVAKMDRSEALASVRLFGQRVMTTAILFVVFVTLLSLWLSAKFLEPVKALVDAACAVGKGDDTVQLDLQGSDEFSELAQTFNEMVANLHRSNAALREKTQEHERLLLNVLPAHVAERVKQGEEHIADTIPNVTVLYADLEGFVELTNTRGANEVVSILNEVVSGFDEAAERHGVERVKTIGSAYLAVCGLSVPRVDHMHRMIMFAKEMDGIVHHIAKRHSVSLNVTVGINSGSVIAGVVGRQRFIFDLWGDTVNMARGLQKWRSNPSGGVATVRVSQAVRDGLAGLHEFEVQSQTPPLNEPQGKNFSSTWILKTGHG